MIRIGAKVQINIGYLRCHAKYGTVINAPRNGDNYVYVVEFDNGSTVLCLERELVVIS